jgi:hypothetical protein
VVRDDYSLMSFPATINSLLSLLWPTDRFGMFGLASFGLNWQNCFFSTCREVYLF